MNRYRADVSAEAWALLGVVIGALLGGAAQVVAGHLRSKYEREHAVREQRQSAYSWLIQTVHESGVALASLQPDEPRPLDAFTGLGAALAHVHLVAPQDTYEAAFTLYNAAASEWGVDPRGGEPLPPSVAMNKFLSFAQRDLGIK